MNIVISLKDFARPTRDLVYAFFGFAYDYSRYIYFSGWRGANSDIGKMDYRLVKIYHRLEKSLSFREVKETSGWGAAKDLMLFLKKTKKIKVKQKPTLHEAVSYKVLRDFSEEKEIYSSVQDESILNFLNAHQTTASVAGGIIEIESKELSKGILDAPEQFFNSRHSIRDYQQRSVPVEDIRRALKMAQKAPSVCNRQAWMVYHLDKREKIDQALSLQNGNRGFGHEIPCLLILTADLKAFDVGGERYQHHIDGGMFSMALVLALHSIGLSSCCLNWSKGPIDDLKLRRMIPISSSHTVLMMLAVGYANEKIKVCYSARNPVDHVYKYIG